VLPRAGRAHLVRLSSALAVVVRVARESRGRRMPQHFRCDYAECGNASSDAGGFEDLAAAPHRGVPHHGDLVPLASVIAARVLASASSVVAASDRGTPKGPSVLPMGIFQAQRHQFIRSRQAVVSPRWALAHCLSA